MAPASPWPSLCPGPSRARSSGCIATAAQGAHQLSGLGSGGDLNFISGEEGWSPGGSPGAVQNRENESMGEALAKITLPACSPLLEALSSFVLFPTGPTQEGQKAPRVLILWGPDEGLGILAFAPDVSSGHLQPRVHSHR